MLSSRGIRWAALACLIAGSAVAAEPPVGAPSAPIHELNAVLLEAMRNAETLGFAGRYELIGPVADRVFNFPLMTRVAVGRSWRSLDADQRTQLVELFARYSISTFADRFDGYGGGAYSSDWLRCWVGTPRQPSSIMNAAVIGSTKAAWTPSAHG